MYQYHKWKPHNQKIDVLVRYLSLKTVVEVNDEFNNLALISHVCLFDRLGNAEDNVY